MTTFTPTLSRGTSWSLSNIFKSTALRPKQIPVQSEQANRERQVLFISDFQQLKTLTIQNSFKAWAVQLADFPMVLADIQITEFNPLLASAIRYMDENVPSTLVEQARPYLKGLNEMSAKYIDFGFPPFSVAMPEDGELLIRWKFDHFTIGLSFELDSEESSWYTVNDGTVRKTTAWGWLSSQPIRELMNKLEAQLLEE